MAVNTRAKLKDYVLRKLGYPVIEINVDDDQVEDRISDALQLFQKYHYDGTERLYLKHQITANNVTDQYIPVPNTIVQVCNIFPFGSSGGSTSSSSPNYIFNINYQIRLSDLYDFSGSISHYAAAKSYIETLNMVLTGTPGIRYREKNQKLYIDIEWGTDLKEGDFIIIECFGIIDPDTYGHVWDDEWLKAYATALVKYQWGSNTKKYINVNLPGGVQMTGQQLFDEAKEEVKELKAELRDSYEEPPGFFVG